MRIKLTKLILVGTKTTEQATGDAGVAVLKGLTVYNREGSVGLVTYVILHAGNVGIFQYRITLDVCTLKQQ